MSIVITGVGSYIPEIIKKNTDFLDNVFVDKKGTLIDQPNEVVVDKLRKITGIEERRYAREDQVASDIASIAAERAIKDAGIDPEELDYIIVGQNFGDIRKGSIQTDQVPSLAARVKHNLKIKTPSCVTYDVIFGCPGWLEGVIQAQAFIKAGMAKKCLVIGAETLSRVVDKHDRDSMIFADGAGATVIEESEQPGGILAHESASYTYTEAPYLNYEVSEHKEEALSKTQYVKMAGRKIYNFALTRVPDAMKSCLDKSGKSIEDLKKLFLHQANEKMDEAMSERFFKLYDKEVPKNIAPMNIHK
ncbi:MAG TPA: ketoacyl-ACP synthase III, partial [Flavobacteriaceae bacterium]|nr:ketoacyl-ACP synthase III [Flavobacteriaceae bacterium]